MAAERIVTTNFMLDTAISFCCSLNYFVLLVTMVDFTTTTFETGMGIAGLVTGIYVIGGLVSRLVFGKYIELVGRRKMLLVGLSIALLMSVAYFFVPSLAVLLAIRFFHGCAYGISSTCTGDIMARILPPARRGEGLGYFYLSVTFSSAMGPFIALVLRDMGDQMVFTVGLAMYVVSFVLALFLKVPEESLTAQQVREARGFGLKSVFQASAVPLAIVCMVFYLGYSGVLSFISPYAEDIGLIDLAPYLCIAISVATFISRLSTGRIYDVHGPNKLMLFSYATFFCGMFLYSQASSGMSYYAAGFLMGFGVSIVFAITQAEVVSMSPPHRYGVTMSTFSSINDLATGLGPMFIGFVIPILGYRDMYLFCLTFTLLSFVLYVTLHGRKVRGRERLAG